MQIPAFTCVTIEDSECLISDLQLAERIDGSDCKRFFK